MLGLLLLFDFCISIINMTLFFITKNNMRYFSFIIGCLGFIVTGMALENLLTRMSLKQQK